MEFCGGHTHAISRYGVRDLLPPNVRMIHGPGCPVCVLPIGRIDMAITAGARTWRDRVHLRRHDARAGVRRPLADARQGARRRHPHGLFGRRRADTLARDNPAREVVFFAIGFETTTPPTALAIRNAQHEGLANFSVLVLPRAHAVGHHAHPGKRPRCGSTARCRSTASSARRTSASSSAPHPYEHFAQEYRKPVVIAGFEPLDVMQAMLMLVRQVNDGARRRRERVHARGRPRGQPECAGPGVRGVRAAADLRMARPGRGAVQRAEDPPGVRAVRRRAALRPRLHAGRRQQGLRVRRHPARREAADRLQDLRHRVHAGKSGGLVHGVERRGVRGALRLRQRGTGRLRTPQPALHSGLDFVACGCGVRVGNAHDSFALLGTSRSRRS
jgi:hypothetical protein